MKEIQQIAKAQGIKPRKLPKTTLIRTIQRNEGNFDCFATAFNGECNQPNCLWREDCIKQAAKAA